MTSHRLAVRAAIFAGILASAALAGCGGTTQPAVTAVVPQSAGRTAGQPSFDREQSLTVSADEPARAAAALTGTWRHKWQPLINHNGPWGPVYYHGGPTIWTAKNYAIYVNCNAVCFGSPQFFFQRLTDSRFVQILDQYTGSGKEGRYTYGGQTDLNYSNKGKLSNSDLNAIVHAVATKYGSGYGKVYHIFLTAQQATPDEYCAYHAWNHYSDIGEVIYSIEPYQLAQPGCEPYNHLHSLPNGLLTDSTDNTLAHEVFESISDPAGTAWWSKKLGEIGDICQYTDNYVTLSGQRFEIQPMSSNEDRACVYGP